VVTKKLGDWQLSQPSATKEIEQVVENIQRENIVVKAMELGYHPGDWIEATHVVKDTKKAQC